MSFDLFFFLIRFSHSTETHLDWKNELTVSTTQRSFLKLSKLLKKLFDDVIFSWVNGNRMKFRALTNLTSGYYFMKEETYNRNLSFTILSVAKNK